jgi:probable rRNA maturation factor
VQIIRIKNTQRKIAINKKHIACLAKQILKIKGLTNIELSILFVGTEGMRQLNKKFRKVDKPTDVLAFAMREGKNSRFHSEILGDVVICPEIARKSARFYKTTKEQEIRLYLIHGILHLLGYNDTNAKNRSLMEKEQTKILRSLQAPEHCA